jgi:hypothetical protein
MVTNKKNHHYINDMIFTSYHEAGHAVYGLMHGIKIPAIFIYENILPSGKPPRGDNYIVGYCFNYPIKNNNRSEIIDNICYTYAGLIAEKILYKNLSGSNQFPMILMNSSFDIHDAFILIKNHNLARAGKHRFFLKRRLMRITLTELQQHWDAVTLVSHVLFNKRVISYLELKKLLTTKTADTKFWINKFKFLDKINDKSVDLLFNKNKLTVSYLRSLQ